MNREAEVHSGSILLGLFLIILAAYIIYIMMISPWERKALLTQQSTINVNVIDCNSGYPINNARVFFYSENGELINEDLTINGVASYLGVPDCLRIKASFNNNSRYDNVCVPSGETRVVTLCYDYPQADPNIIYLNDYVGLIGGTSGEVVSKKTFPNFLLSYPLNNATVEYPSYFLYANIFWSEGMKIVLEDINTSFTKDVDFQFTIDSVRGNPVVSVYVNDQLFYYEPAVTGEVVHVLIPEQSLNETLNLQVKCAFKGVFFWTTQDCNLTNIKAIQSFYIPQKIKQEFNFSTSSMEINASSADLSFKSLDNAIGGIKALINDVTVFDSNSIISSNYSSSIPVSKINLTSDNKIVFQANPGAELWVSNASIEFTTPVTPKEKETLSFVIMQEDYESMKGAVINFFITNIYYNGELLMKVNDMTYVTTTLKAGWNTINLEKQDLLTQNTLEISALSGRYEIKELKIVKE